MSDVTKTRDIEQLAVDTIKFLSVDAVQKANSGHPGLPTGAMDYAYVLWNRFMRFVPDAPDWPNRDRFILSAGHGCMLLYSLLHLTGYDVTLDDLKSFRQWGSITPGHPEFGVTPGVECTTGPLGQGITNGVGMALAAKMLAARFNRPGYELFTSRIFAICSDGDLMEGISHEAASFAGHLGLGNIIYLYDDNHISIGGRTDITYTDDVEGRFTSYGWHVQKIDGHDRRAAEQAIQAAIDEAGKPSLIIARTTIAKDAPTKRDTPGAHGEPLGAEEISRMKEALGWPQTPDFHVPDGVYEHFRSRPEQVKAEYQSWREMLTHYRQEFPDLASELDAMLGRKTPADLLERLLEVADSLDADATRSYGGKIMNAAAKLVPALAGGSADLEPSTKTLLSGTTSISKESFEGRNIHFGVREHGMGGIVNGMAYFGGFIPYGATFMVFSDYMRPSARLSALSHLQSIWVWTHDSIFVGEDGPTHEPIEHLASLRAIPNLKVFRPADAAETAAAWTAALENRNGPSALALSRQKAPAVERSGAESARGAMKGAYVVSDPPEGKPEAIVIATGTEVKAAQEAVKALEAEGRKIRLVSMPCWELFDEQDQAYRDSVLLPDVTKRVSVEAGATFGWDRYVGRCGLKIGIDRFGASAPMKELAEQFGFTPERIAGAIRDYLG